jgi:hypothetical protein
VSVKSLIDQFEKEKEEIREKISKLQQRDEVLDLLLKELKGASRSTSGKAGEKKRAATRKVAKKAAKGRRKGKLTVREGILQALASAHAPLTAGEIIAQAADLSGGAKGSIRTQLNSLTRAKEIHQMPYEGRGFKYRLGKGRKAPARKKTAKKKAAKKKTTKKAAPKPEQAPASS